MDPRRASDPLARILGEIPPGSGAMVMGTGIVSVALSLDGRESVSRILLVICAVAWMLVGVLLGVRLWRDLERVEKEAGRPRP
jgi:tellurite resistance protein TehA-like permease